MLWWEQGFLYIQHKALPWRNDAIALCPGFPQTSWPPFSLNVESVSLTMVAFRNVKESYRTRQARSQDYQGGSEEADGHFVTLFPQFVLSESFLPHPSQFHCSSSKAGRAGSLSDHRQALLPGLLQSFLRQRELFIIRKTSLYIERHVQKLHMVIICTALVFELSFCVTGQVYLPG